MKGKHEISIMKQLRCKGEKTADKVKVSIVRLHVIYRITCLRWHSLFSLCLCHTTTVIQKGFGQVEQASIIGFWPRLRPFLKGLADSFQSHCV